MNEHEKLLEMMVEFYNCYPYTSDVETEEMTVHHLNVENRTKELNKLIGKEDRFNTENVNWKYEYQSKMYN